MENDVLQFVLGLVQENPRLSVALMFIGVFRAVFKPVMLVVERYVEATETKNDDEWLENLKKNKVYLAIAWLADYLLSIKLPKKNAE